MGNSDKFPINMMKFELKFDRNDVYLLSNSIEMTDFDKNDGFR